VVGDERVRLEAADGAGFLALDSAGQPFLAGTARAGALFVAIPRFSCSPALDRQGRAPLADPDEDGVVNLLERAFVGDAEIPSAEILPIGSVTGSGAEAYLEISYRKSRYEDTLRLVAETATDLSGPWTASPAEVAFARTEALPGNVLRHVYRRVQPLSAQSRAFMRVRVIDDSAERFLEDSRLHAHMRVTQTRTDELPFYKVRERMAGLGVSNYTRHVKTDDEDPWWKLPSFRKIPPIESGFTANQTAAIVRDIFSRDDGINANIIGYYWLGTHESQRLMNLDWSARDPLGNIASHDNKGPEIDITRPAYQSYAVARLRELADFGAKGAYFDNRHGNSEGVFGTALADGYVAAGGILPTAVNLNDANYVRYLRYNADQLADAMASICGQVRATHPNFKFLISCTTVPNLVHPLMSSRLASLSDAPKIEYRLAVMPGSIPDPVIDDMRIAPYADITTRLAYGSNLLRTASGAFPHVWGAEFVNYGQTEAFVASTIAFGGIANLDIFDSFVLAAPEENPTSHGLTEDQVRTLIALGKRISTGLRGLRPLPYAAVYHSEFLRDRYDRRFLSAWQNVLAPPLMTYEALSRRGVPTDVITDHVVRERSLSAYRHIFVVERNLLPAAEKAALLAYESAGGQVYSISIDVPGRALSASTQADVAAVIADSPVRWTASHPLHSTVFGRLDGDRLYVGLTNDVSWIQEFRDTGYLTFNSWGAQIDTTYTVNPPPPVAIGPQIFIATTRRPAAVIDRYSGENVPWRGVSGGIEVTVPSFALGAMVELRF
jgi:hypothetical protein